jgi:hypothetical protein
MGIWQEEEISFNEKYTDQPYIVSIEYKVYPNSLDLKSWKLLDPITHKEILIQDKEFSSQVEKYVLDYMEHKENHFYFDEEMFYGY